MAEEDTVVTAADVTAVESAYESWWSDWKDELQASYSDCTEVETPPMVVHYLVSASPYMAATHCRACNLNADFSQVEAARHVPINTDVVESGFAHFDDALKLNASIKAMIGVAHAKTLKAFSTDGEKKDMAMATAQKGEEMVVVCLLLVETLLRSSSSGIRLRSSASPVRNAGR